MNRLSLATQGNRRGPRGGKSSPHFSTTQKTRTVPPPLGSNISTQLLNQIPTNGAPGDAEITDCEFVASYNLLEGLQQTIFVPGRPPVWTPLPGSIQLQPDRGTYYRDENAARFPDYPLAPAVHSIRAMNPSLERSAINVFACGSTLGDLLRFTNGNPQPFAFVVHIPDSSQTAFFLRRNHSPAELIDNVYGYGHTFPETYTTWTPDVAGSASHQRILAYTFAGLRLLVRFEADGYTIEQADVDSDSGSEHEDDGAKLSDKRPEKNQDNAASATMPSETTVEELTQSLARPLQPSISPSDSSGNVVHPLKMLRRGRRVPQASIFDLKTRSATKPREGVMAEQLPRLWVRQIEQFVLAFHTRGVFETPDVMNVSGKINGWEQGAETALQRMAGLIRNICDEARKAKGRKVEVRGGESEELDIHAVEGEEAGKWNALPKDLEGWWAEK